MQACPWDGDNDPDPARPTHNSFNIQNYHPRYLSVSPVALATTSPALALSSSLTPRLYCYQRQGYPRGDGWNLMVGSLMRDHD